MPRKSTVATSSAPVSFASEHQSVVKQSQKDLFLQSSNYRPAKMTQQHANIPNKNTAGGKAARRELVTPQIEHTYTFANFVSQQRSSYIRRRESMFVLAGSTIHARSPRRAALPLGKCIRNCIAIALARAMGVCSGRHAVFDSQHHSNTASETVTLVPRHMFSRA
jgi:hypothetical protein